MKPGNLFASGKKQLKSKKQFMLKLKINIWTVALALVLILFVGPLLIAGIQLGSSSNKVDISQLVTDIKDKKVDKVLVESNKLLITYKDKSTKISTKEEGQNFTDILNKSGVDPSSVNYSIIDQSLSKTLGDVVGIVLPLTLMAAFFYSILRAQNKGAHDIFSFGRSKARLFAKGKQDITFK